MVSALIVDDEEDIRILLRAVIERTGSIAVVGEAGTGDDAVARWRELGPDVVVMDNRMPGLTGIEACATILGEKPDQSIILFTAFKDPALEREAERLGVRACLNKSDLAELPSLILEHADPSS